MLQAGMPRGMPSGMPCSTPRRLPLFQCLLVMRRSSQPGASKLQAGELMCEYLGEYGIGWDSQHFIEHAGSTEIDFRKRSPLENGRKSLEWQQQTASDRKWPHAAVTVIFPHFSRRLTKNNPQFPGWNETQTLKGKGVTWNERGRTWTKKGKTWSQGGGFKTKGHLEN